MVVVGVVVVEVVGAVTGGTVVAVVVVAPVWAPAGAPTATRLAAIAAPSPNVLTVTKARRLAGAAQVHVVRVAVRHRLGGDLPEPPGLVVGKRLEDLFSSVHYKRAVVYDRFLDGFAPKDQHLRVGAGGTLPWCGAELQEVSRPEDDELARMDRPVIFTSCCLAR